MSVPVRLIVPAHRISSIQSEECRKWCAECLKMGVSTQADGKVHLLVFESWEDAALFQRKWL